MPSTRLCRQPYLLSNLDLVTESLTLIAGNLRVPALAISYSRCTPVVVSSVTPLMDCVALVHLPGLSARELRSRSRMTFHSSESLSSGLGTAPACSYSAPLWTNRVASPPSSRIMFGTSPPGQVSAPPVLLERLALPREDRDALRIVRCAVRADRDGRRGVVLGGEDVAARPPYLGAERGEGLDQDGGLHRHVQRSGDAGTPERLLLRVLLADRHQTGHLVLGK